MESLMQEEKPCHDQHRWGGIVPEVNAELFEVQNAALIDKLCDCGNFIYKEERCGCAIPQWKIVYEFNQKQ